MTGHEAPDITPEEVESGLKETGAMASGSCRDVNPITEDGSLETRAPENRLPVLLREISEELAVATEMFGRFNSPHEGYAVTLDRLDKLWDEVKKWPNTHDLQKMRKECIKMAAMSLRFIRDLECIKPDYEVVEGSGPE